MKTILKDDEGRIELRSRENEGQAGGLSESAPKERADPGAAVTDALGHPAKI